MTTMLEGIGIGIVIDVIFNVVWHKLMVEPHFKTFVKHHHLHDHAIKDEHKPLTDNNAVC